MNFIRGLAPSKSAILQQRVHVSYLAFLVFLWAVTGCAQERNAPSEPVSLSVSFEQELVIRDDEETHRDALLASPSEIRTDSAGNIYVADRQDLLIKVFDATGHFKHAIGGSGEGPGEFASIASIDINNDDELIVFDGRNNRITHFSDTGEVLSTLTRASESGNVIWPHYSRQVNEKRHVMLRKLRDTPGEEGEEQEHLPSQVLHLFDHTYENRIASFGHIDSLMDASSAFVRLYMHSFSPGHFWPTNDGSIWYAPSLYAGHVFKFEEDPDGWNLAMSAEGHVIPQQPVSIDDDSEGIVSITTYGGENAGTFSGRIESESLGLFVRSDGRLIHFSSQRSESEKVLMVEVFTPEGELEGVGQLEGFSVAETQSRSPLRSFWMDERDQFYFIDHRDTPLVRVGRIEGV